MVKDEERRADASSHAGDDTSSTPPGERAVRRQPARAAEIENLFRRAINHLDRNEYNRAARAFRSVLRLDPEHYQALTGLGRCLMEIGMREEARECFRKALEIKPDYTQARLNLELRG